MVFDIGGYAPIVGSMEYNIAGTLSQYLDITLEKGEEIFADPGTLICKDAALLMDPRMQGGLGQGLKRMLAGAGFNLVYFIGPGKLSLSKNRSGKVIVLDLKEDDVIDVHPGALVMAQKSVSVDLHTQDFQTGVLGGTGLFWARLKGPGFAFVHAWGDFKRQILEDGEAIQVNRGHLIFKHAGVGQSMSNLNLKTALFGGAGAYLLTLMGPGEIGLQSRTKSAATASPTKVDIRPPSRQTPPPR